MPIVHNLVWAPLKNCSSSEAFKFILRLDNFMIYFNGGFSMELSYRFSFLVVTILASTFQYVSSKSISQERSEDFPGVRTIFKTYPNFLLSSLVTFPHYICYNSVNWVRLCVDEMAIAIGEKIRLDTLPSRTTLTFC